MTIYDSDIASEIYENSFDYYFLLALFYSQLGTEGAKECLSSIYVPENECLFVCSSFQ